MMMRPELQGVRYKFKPFGPDENPIAIRFRNPANWEAGDVLLFHARTFGLMTFLIHVVTQSWWNHAALYLGEGKYVEATSGGVRVSQFSEHYMKDKGADESSHVDEVIGVRIIGMYDDEDDRNDVLAFAAGRVGTKYGYLNAFFCGLRHVFTGLTIKRGDTIICSELVAEALERAGFDFGKDSSEVSPGDIGEVFGVGR